MCLEQCSLCGHQYVLAVITDLITPVLRTHLKDIKQKIQSLTGEEVQFSVNEKSTA